MNRLDFSVFPPKLLLRKLRAVLELQGKLSFGFCSIFSFFLNFSPIQLNYHPDGTWKTVHTRRGHDDLAIRHVRKRGIRKNKNVEFIQEHDGIRARYTHSATSFPKLSASTSAEHKVPHGNQTEMVPRVQSRC